METRLNKALLQTPPRGSNIGNIWFSYSYSRIVKANFGANPIPTPAPDQFVGSFNVGALIGLDASYPYWRLIYFLLLH